MKTVQLDVTKDHCPMTFVKAKVALTRLETGDRLEVLLTEGEPLDNLPRSATEQGYKVISVEPVGGVIHRVTIEK